MIPGLILQEGDVLSGIKDQTSQRLPIKIINFYQYSAPVDKKALKSIDSTPK